MASVFPVSKTAHAALPSPHWMANPAALLNNLEISLTDVAETMHVTSSTKDKALTSGMRRSAGSR